MNIQVGFTTREGNPVSSIIRAVTGKKFSHTIIIDANIVHAPTMVFEAAGLYVRALPLKEFVRDNQLIHTIDIPCLFNQYREFSRYNFSVLSKPFGIASMFGVGVAKIASLKRNPFDDDNKSMHCSEYVKNALWYLGINIPMDSDLIGPDDLYDILKKRL